MSNQRPSFAKREREMKLKDKARAKAERRAARKAEPRAGSGPEIADTNERYDTVLTQAGIAHVFRTYPGGHQLSLWESQAPRYTAHPVISDGKRIQPRFSFPDTDSGRAAAAVLEATFAYGSASSTPVLSTEPSSAMTISSGTSLCSNKAWRVSGNTFASLYAATITARLTLGPWFSGA